MNNKQCKEDVVNLHDIEWSAPNQCVDGGVLRARSTYTNINTSGFKTDVGYSGHFYGIRKYDGLTPHAPYSIVVEGKTGSNTSIKTPREFTEVEYGSDNFVNYSGLVLPQSGLQVAKSIDIKQDLIAVGFPYSALNYSEYSQSGTLDNFILPSAGAIYVYKRDNRPSGYNWPEDEHKSAWVLDEVVTLPSGFLKDYYDVSYTNKIGGVSLPLPIEEKRWKVGQEGRELGHSVALAVVNSGEPSFGEENRKILVAGGPSSRWSDRTFENLSASGVQIGLMVITDEFTPRIPYIRNNQIYYYKDHTLIQESIKNKDLIFQYFSDPPVKFDVKLIVLEPLADNSIRKLEDFPEPKPNYIIKKRISRNSGLINQERTSLILNQIKEAFHEAFPYDTNKLHNNVPAILGLYIDDSASLGKDAVNPAIDQFIQYYNQYSFASGLRDFYGTRASGEVVELVDISEDWIANSQSILDTVLDTGRLLRENQVRFFTSGVGLEARNENLSQFNYPPPSGGSVFIFEKESGSWNCIQEIPSPNIIYDIPDRFGHSVSISENSEILAIGSPYISKACQIYEYRKSEKNRLYYSLHQWLYYKSSVLGGNNVRYNRLIDNYANWSSYLGAYEANKLLYGQLTSTEKFEARRYLNISEYQLVTEFGGHDIVFTGPEDPTKDADAWEFILDRFLPTPRLGYSIAVNDDGTKIAVGAPTDSINRANDARVYYKNHGSAQPGLATGLVTSSWSSTVNAGAVTILEGRKYYPHNKVVEYGKFGNLQENIGDPLDSGHFNYLSNIFQYKNFERTSFEEVNIPQDAGLVFIITPAIDALSEEILDNISNWLALGDRNLVLVGNDPSWEQNGAYAESNEIINKILKHLKSRMILVPARNKEEALVKTSGCGQLLPSFVPDNTSSTHIIRTKLPCYGVADIRMNLIENDQFKALMPCQPPKDTYGSIIAEFMDPTPANDKCELPLRHLGDLRAQWLEKCLNAQLKTEIFPVNWATLFKTYQPQCLTATDIPLYGNYPGQEPIPLLAAADLRTETVVIPAREEQFKTVGIFVDKIIINNEPFVLFDIENISTEAAMVWTSDSNNYKSINYNANNSTSIEKFYIPPEFEERQALLQSRAIPAQEILQDRAKVYDKSYFATEEQYGQSSHIVLIASVEPEGQGSLYSGYGDRNVNFYINMVSQPYQRGNSRIAQLGGWTGRSSFTDANSSSILYEVFTNSNNEVDLNVQTISSYYDVCWIADPIQLPSQQQAQELLSWLSQPKKKLIVTFSNNDRQARLITDLMSMLNSKMKPFYSTTDEAFVAPDGLFGALEINTNHPVSIGYNAGSSIQRFIGSFRYKPLIIEPNITPIAFMNAGVFQKRLSTVGYWKMDSGLTKITFPAIANSGYRLFFTGVAESPSENQPITIAIENVTQSFNLPLASNFALPISIPNYPPANIGAIVDLNAQIRNKPFTAYVDVQALGDEISVLLFSFDKRIPLVTDSYIPKTCRLLSVSGVPVPIIKTSRNRISKQTVLDRYETVKVQEAVPEQTVITTRFDYIRNLNDQYCLDQCLKDFGGKYIADGPVVAAQEKEHFSNFDAGFQRSTITLLADSAIVQGRCMGDEFFRASEESVRFIRSLYPDVFFGNVNTGRNFDVITKIVSPERGSPQKYLSQTSSSNSGINTLFGGPQLVYSFSNFNSRESDYDPIYIRDPEAVYTEEHDTDLKKAVRRQQLINQFVGLQLQAGATAKFSGIIDNTLYADANYKGGMPKLMKDLGYDYLDPDKFTDSYKGDLFGYSLAWSKNRLIVGSPGSAFKNSGISSWEQSVNNSGLSIGYDGGAGSVYIFEQTFNGDGYGDSTMPWECTQKLRPSNLSVGSSGSPSDKFGSSLSMSSDIIAVSAPYHDYGNSYFNGSGQFIRKSFNQEFTIPERIVTQLPSSGGLTNMGAVFLFENSIVDWANKTKSWTLIEKLTPELFGISGANDNFGRVVSIDRANRTDADYSVATLSFSNSGQAQTCDIMIREQPPSIPSPDAFIHATIFGETDNQKYPSIFIEVKNNNENSLSHFASGIVYTDSKGQIFLEASGQDPVVKGFIQHRPYIKSVNGQYFYGIQNSNNLGLFIDSQNPPKSGSMPIYTKVDNSANVYNSVGLYNGAIIGFATDPSGLNLYLDSPDPTSVSESGLFLYTASGIGIATAPLNMRIRGK